MRKHLRFAAYLSVAIAFSSSYAGPREDLLKAVELDTGHQVKALLQQSVDPNLRDDQGQVPLFLALRTESYKAAAELLNDPRTEVDLANPNGETPLMMAALRGNLEWAQRLLDRGAKVNREGWTPLHYAASGGEPKLVRLLLERGAVIDAKSPNGTTPLMMAARYGAIDSADLLRERGADLALRNERGLNAADFAAGAGRDTLVQRLQVR
jgi:uncharacterized protein